MPAVILVFDDIISDLLHHLGCLDRAGQFHQRETELVCQLHRTFGNRPIPRGIRQNHTGQLTGITVKHQRL
ncbi:hypothetical protein D3C81_2213990 [compost metagenome]